MNPEARQDGLPAGLPSFALTWLRQSERGRPGNRPTKACLLSHLPKRMEIQKDKTLENEKTTRVIKGLY